jgi:excisionase family DNA binding protein
MLVSIPTAASLIGVSTATVRRWYRQGRLPVVRLSKRAIRIDLDDLNDFLFAGRALDAHSEHAGLTRDRRLLTDHEAKNVGRFEG